MTIRHENKDRDKSKRTQRIRNTELSDLVSQKAQGSEDHESNSGHIEVSTEALYELYKRRLASAMRVTAYHIKKSPLHVKATAKGVANFTLESAEFIWNSYINPSKRELRKENRKAIYNAMRTELHYGKFFSGVFEIIAPLPIEQDAGYFASGFVYGLVFGRTHEESIKSLTTLIGAKTERQRAIFKHGIYISEYAMDVFAGLQNALFTYLVSKRGIPFQIMRCWIYQQDCYHMLYCWQRGKHSPGSYHILQR